MSEMVLIIEDDPDIAEIVRYTLEKAHFLTRVAYSGEEGLHASLDKLNPPSVILLDLLLPGMTGHELCRRLRRETLTQKTPILVLTAKAMEADINFALAVGATEVMIKPFSIDELVTRVRSLAQRGH
jgi:DNA-binding response OmpR family regulator